MCLKAYAQGNLLNLAQTTCHHRCKVSISFLYKEPGSHRNMLCFFLLFLFFLPLLFSCIVSFSPGQMYKTNSSYRSVEKSKQWNGGLLWCVWWVSGVVWQKSLTLNPRWLFSWPWWYVVRSLTPPQLTCWALTNKTNRCHHACGWPLTSPFRGPAELLCLWILRFSSQNAGNTAI